MTIHNIAFKGFFGAEIFGQLRLPPEAFAVGGVEYFGGISYLKSGMECADYVTTVSPNYADEIRTPEFGMGLEGLLNGRAETVVGILNGIDTEAWNPATDPALVRTFTANTIHGRQANKQAVVEKFALDGMDGPLFCVISRLTDQKGMDLLLQVIDGLVDLGGRLAVLGSGDAALEDALQVTVVAGTETHTRSLTAWQGGIYQLGTALAAGASIPVTVQITLPLGQIDGAPFGLSLLGPAGSDRRPDDVKGRAVNSENKNSLPGHVSSFVFRQAVSAGATDTARPCGSS